MKVSQFDVDHARQILSGVVHLSDLFPPYTTAGFESYRKDDGSWGIRPASWGADR